MARILKTGLAGLIVLSALACTQQARAGTHPSVSRGAMCVGRRLQSGVGMRRAGLHQADRRRNRRDRRSPGRRFGPRKRWLAQRRLQLAGGRVFLTPDECATWTQISSADSDIDVLSIVRWNSNLPAGTVGGIYKSPDYGSTWTASSSGIPASAVMTKETIDAQQHRSKNQPPSAGRREFLRSLGAAALAGMMDPFKFARAAITPGQKAIHVTDLCTATITGLSSNCTLIRLDTDKGISGYGECGCEDTSALSALCALRPTILGMDPTRVDKVFNAIKNDCDPFDPDNQKLTSRKT